MRWLLALHLISMVTWFSALFYLPRLYVYHSLAEDKISQERFKIMERKLYYGIMMPGMIFTLIFGFSLLALEPYYWHSLWLELKLLLVFSLVIFHFYCGHLRRAFALDRNQHSHRFYRWLNEYPTLILILVIILAVIKPF